jgi:hypothetical protein
MTLRNSLRAFLGAIAVLAVALPPVTASGGSLTLLGAGKPAVVASGYVGPGDVVAGATVWLGLRAYTAAQAAANAKAIKVFRVADSHTCDILLSSAGGLGNTANCSTPADNLAAAASFCTTTCTIDTFYDQTTNGLDFLESARATLVFNCIGTLPCADFAGTSWYANFGMPALSQPFTTSTVAIRTGALAAQNDLFDVGQGSFFAAQVGGVGKVGGFWGASGVASETDSAWHAIQIVTSGASSAVAVDATQTTGLNMGTTANPSPTLWLGTQASGGTNPFTGKLTEIAIWPSAFTGAQQTSICANQHAYWGTPTSC